MEIFDVLYNFKHYFPRCNAKNILEKLSKKMEKNIFSLQGSAREIKKFSISRDSSSSITK